MDFEAECAVSLERLRKAHNEQQAAWAALIRVKTIDGNRKANPHHLELHERWEQSLSDEDAVKAAIEKLRRDFRFGKVI